MDMNNIEKKSGEQLFALLNKDEQARFTENISAYGLYSINDINSKSYYTFCAYILGAFPFDKSTEGAEYWAKIAESERDGVSLNDSVHIALYNMIKRSLEEVYKEGDISGEELYNLMSREERSQFYDEFVSQRDDFDEFIQLKYRSFSDFIEYAFKFSDSKLGYDYWRNFTNKYSFNAVYDMFDELNIKTNGAT